MQYDGRPRSTFEIRVRGHLGELARFAFRDLDVQPQSGDTVLSGALLDLTALQGVLVRIDTLGLELVEVRRLAARGAGRGPG